MAGGVGGYPQGFTVTMATTTVIMDTMPSWTSSPPRSPWPSYHHHHHATITTKVTMAIMDIINNKYITTPPSYASAGCSLSNSPRPTWSPWTSPPRPTSWTPRSPPSPRSSRPTRSSWAPRPTSWTPRSTAPTAPTISAISTTTTIFSLDRWNWSRRELGQRAGAASISGAAGHAGHVGH